MLKYFFTKSIKGFFEKLPLNAISMGIITIILIIFSTYLLIISNLNKQFGSFKNQMRVFVYFKTGTSDSNIQKSIKLINKIENVAKVTLHSSKQNLDQFTQLFKNDIKHKQDFSKIPNPFPPSLQLDITGSLGIQKLKTISKNISSNKEISKHIDEIDYGSKWLEGAIRGFKALKQSGLIFLAVLFSGLFLIVFNTLKLSFLSRTKEIEIMKIMGATNTFIIAPFLLESILLGLISSCTAVGILYGFWCYINDELLKISFLFHDLHFFDIWHIGLIIVLGTLMVLGSAYLSLTKCIKDIR